MKKSEGLKADGLRVNRMDWAGLRVVVTGGAGFIGSHIATTLADSGAIVTVLDDLSTGSEEVIPTGVKFIKGSITDVELLKSTLEEQDAVFHLAAIASVPRCESEPTYSDEVNRLASLKILGLANCPVIFASSAAIYGEPVRIPIDESHPISPLGRYGEQKASIDQFIRRPNSHSTPATALRFFNVYGPGQDPSSQYSGVLSIFIDRAKSKRGLEIFGDGEQTRDFVHVSDVVSACVKACESLLQQGTDSPLHAAAFNVCTGEAVTLNQIITTMESTLGTSLDLTYSAARVGDVRESLGDPSKLKSSLDWEPQVSLESGLADLLGIN